MDAAGRQALAIDQAFVTVQDIVVQAQDIGGDGTIVEGQPFTGEVATFTSTESTAVAADFAAAITWEDGSVTPGTISQGIDEFGGTTFFVTGTHTFLTPGESEPFTVAVEEPALGQGASEDWERRPSPTRL